MFARKLLIVLMVMVIAGVALPVGAQAPQPAPQQPAFLVLAPEIFDRASAALRGGDFDRAVLDYSLFILVNPTFGQAYIARSFAHEGRGDFDAAIADLGSALKFTTDPEQVSELHSARASLFIRQENLRAALDELNNSLTLQPDNPDNYLTRARIYILQQRFADAVGDYDEIIRLQPEHNTAYLDRGELHVVLGNYDEAITDLDHAIELAPNSVEAYFSRAQAYIGKADFDAALADLNNAIELDPETDVFYLNRGYVNSVLENEVRAADDYFRWLSSTQTRRIEEVAISADEPLTVEMHEGFVYRIPFEARSGQSLSLQANSPAATVDPLVIILDTDGNPLIANDDIGETLNAAITDFAVPRNGTYTIVLGHARGGSDGEVVVTLGLS